MLPEVGKRVGAKEARKMKARREKDLSARFGLGMFGVVGYIGVALGCLNAWNWVEKEGRCD